MLVAVARHAGRKRTPAGLLPGKSGGALLAKLAGEPRGAGARLHPRGAGAGQIGGDGRRGQGHSRQLGRVWGEGGERERSQPGSCQISGSVTAEVPGILRDLLVPGTV